jgi:AbrB family looped-hinge helix DNA binding protein
VTIPAQVRQELGLVAGSRLVMYVEDGRLVLEDGHHLLGRIQDRVSREAGASGAGSAVDELIADRRVEASREAGESHS